MAARQLQRHRAKRLDATGSVRRARDGYQQGRKRAEAWQTGHGLGSPIYQLCRTKYPAAMSDAPQRPSIVALFLGFFSVGMFGFGGVLPWARRMAVEQKHWMTATEFTELLGLCQFLPGGNIMNVTIALGARFHGIPGALAAFVGLMPAPEASVIA